MKRDFLPLPWTAFMLRSIGAVAVAKEIAACFEARGPALVSTLKQRGHLRAGDRLLEIYCGAGCVARALVDEDIAKYFGFDRHPDMVAWCNREIGRRDSRFEFFQYGEEHVGAGWPWPAGSIDLVLLGPLLSSIPLESATGVLREVARTLAPGRSAYAEICLSIGPAARTQSLFWIEQAYTDAFVHIHERAAFLRELAAAGLRLEFLEPPAVGPVPTSCILTRS